jgi:hypothetical protein
MHLDLVRQYHEGEKGLSEYAFKRLKHLYRADPKALEHLFADYHGIDDLGEYWGVVLRAM